MIAALLIFSGTYLVLSVGRMPGFRIDRTGAAIIGAALMIAFRVLTMDEAIRSVNHETLILLFGMMIVVANLRLSGFFALVSAMMIGTFSQIPYKSFAAAIAPISAIGLFLTVVLIAAIYRREFIGVPRIDIEKPRVRVHKALLGKSVTAAGAMIILFFMGFSVPKVAVVTGAILLITRRVKPEKVYREIDWSLLVLFVGLFVVIAGVEKTLLTGDILALGKRLQLDRTGVLTVWSAILSNLVSNVPVGRKSINTFRTDLRMVGYRDGKPIHQCTMRSHSTVVVLP
jgi:Na+/H+ antiporter NhaD/arsenite permease-like protein